MLDLNAVAGGADGVGVPTVIESLFEIEGRRLRFENACVVESRNNCSCFTFFKNDWINLDGGVL